MKQNSLAKAAETRLLFCGEESEKQKFSSVSHHFVYKKFQVVGNEGNLDEDFC
jgi:hypothetical protein